MIEQARRLEILNELLEKSDGTQADSYALLKEEFEEIEEELKKRQSTIDSLTEKNSALKAENFRLFERVGVQNKEGETPPAPAEEEGAKDYLSEVIDKNGFFR